MVAAVDVRLPSGGTITAPTGWQLVRRDSNLGGASLSQAVYVRVAGVLEPASYAWRFSSSTGAAAGIVAYGGIDGAVPVDAHSGLYSSNTASIRAPSVNAKAGGIVLGFFGNNGKRPTTPPAGMVERFDVSSTSGTATSEAADMTRSSAGATGDRTAFATASNSSSIGQLVALRPLGTATTPPPTNSSPPTVSGTPSEGEMLTAAPGSWSGAGPITYAYQWRACDDLGASCADIAGATAQSHRLTLAEVGKTIRVAVTASGAGGSTTVASTHTGRVLPALPPVSTSPPTISGTAREGQVLTASPGSWSGTAPIAYVYRWRACDGAGAACVDVSGATAQTFALTASQVGKTMRVLVTASNVAGSAGATSAHTAVVAAAAGVPVNSSPPTASGTARQGQTLTASPGSWSGTAPITHAYRWRACDGAGAACVDVAGATAQTFALTASQVGKTMRVLVTASNVAGSADATSAQTALVAGLDVAPANVSPPTISGSAQQGQVLTAFPGTWSGTAPFAYAYRWRACDGSGAGCVDIAGATSQSYSLTVSEVGKTIRAVVTASNAVGSAGATTAQTAPVAALAPGGSESFYVSPSGSDTNPGTFASPWRTLGKAMASLAPGQTAYLRAGTYEENKAIACGSEYNRLRWANSGSPFAFVTIAGFPGEEKQVVVKTALDLNGNYQRLLNLVVDKNLGASSFDGGACTGTLSVSIYGDYNEVRGIEIRNSNMSALYLSGADHAKVIGNYIHSNGVHNNLDHGLYYSSGTNGLIANNLFANNEAQGVCIYPSPSKITVAQNTIVGNGKSGVFIGGNSTTGRFATDTLVVNNVSAFNGEYGIRSYWGGQIGTGNTAVRNVVFGNTAGALYLAPGGLTASETILQDPRFVSASSGDYRLLSGSPAIGAARPEHSQTHDFDGRARDAQPDIGAFEH